MTDFTEKMSLKAIIEIIIKTSQILVDLELLHLMKSKVAEEGSLLIQGCL